MDTKDYGLILGIASAALWALKVIGEKLVGKYFEIDKNNQELRESFMTEKLNWLQKDIGTLSESIKQNTSEAMQTRMKLQSLDHELAALRSELKHSVEHSKKSSESLVAVLKSFQGELKSQRSEIEMIGRVIMRIPEQK